MAVTKLFELVNEIQLTNDYWFVRTDSGAHFETFYKNSFVGINWNYVTVEDLKKRSVEDLKNRIIKREDLNPDDPYDKGKATAIYNKLLRFSELKKGDRIIIPSTGSEYLAFGVISDKAIYVDEKQSFQCEYYKRRKVKWFRLEKFEDLDPTVYKIRMSRHAISSINEHAWFIDRIMDSVFTKEGNSHLVLDIQKKGNINLKHLNTMVTEIEKLMQKANDYFELGEDISESYIKLNLQSPGKIEIILKKGFSLIILAAVIASLGGDINHQKSYVDKLPIPANEKKEIQTFIDINRADIDAIDSVMQSLDVPRDRINSGLIDGPN